MYWFHWLLSGFWASLAGWWYAAYRRERRLHDDAWRYHWLMAEKWRKRLADVKVCAPTQHTNGSCEHCRYWKRHDYAGCVTALTDAECLPFGR